MRKKAVKSTRMNVFKNWMVINVIGMMFVWVETKKVIS